MIEGSGENKRPQDLGCWVENEVEDKRYTEKDIKQNPKILKKSRTSLKITPKNPYKSPKSRNALKTQKAFKKTKILKSPENP